MKPIYLFVFHEENHTHFGAHTNPVKLLEDAREPLQKYMAQYGTREAALPVKAAKKAYASMYACRLNGKPGRSIWHYSFNGQHCLEEAIEEGIQDLQRFVPHTMDTSLPSTFVTALPSLLATLTKGGSL